MNYSKRFLFGICKCLTALSAISNAHADDEFPRSTREMAAEAIKYSQLQQNWVFSPLSANACLSMAYAGSDGRTADELLRALFLTSDQNLIGKTFNSFAHNLMHQPAYTNDFTLNIAQGLWSQSNFSFLDQYMTSMHNDFEAMIESVDFSLSTIDHINKWFADQTQQKIKKLFNPGDIDSSTRLVLGNALYFKGSWTHQFKKENTKPQPFTLSSDQVAQVQMMDQTETMGYFEDSDWQAVSLTFQKSWTAPAAPACVLLLPKKNQPLTAEKIEEILNSFEWHRVHLQVPKFTFDKHFDLQQFLQSLGVSDAFTPSANFSKMDGRLDLYISTVVQKCFFALDEQGVEAAAATGAVMNCTCCKPFGNPPIEFIANRPFEFLLIDQTSNTCLMVGHVADPLGAVKQ